MSRSQLRAGVVAVALLSAATACTSTPPPAPVGSGLLPGYDRQVRAQDDLFQFVNGQWLSTTEIPADRTRYGVFDLLTEQSQRNLRAIIEDSAARDAAAGSPDQQIGDFYESFMDTTRLDALGAAPLTASLDRIDALASPSDVVRYLGESAAISVPSPVSLYITQDARNASAYIPHVAQSGLTRPNRDYYLKSEPQFVTLRDQLRAYVARVLGLAGVADPAAAAGQVVALENRLAEVQWTAEQERDVTATYNKFTVADATAITPGLDWQSYLDAAGVRTPDFIVA
ncbi:MAG: hypothetical protein ACRDRG_05095, partial [Pseudonocardiaceae bacterium]